MNAAYPEMRANPGKFTGHPMTVLDQTNLIKARARAIESTSRSSREAMPVRAPGTHEEASRRARAGASPNAPKGAQLNAPVEATQEILRTI